MSRLELTSLLDSLPRTFKVCYCGRNEEGRSFSCHACSTERTINTIADVMQQSKAELSEVTSLIYGQDSSAGVEEELPEGKYSYMSTAELLNEKGRLLKVRNQRITAVMNWYKSL